MRWIPWPAGEIEVEDPPWPPSPAGSGAWDPPWPRECVDAEALTFRSGDFAWIWASPSPAGRRLRMGLGGTLACAAATSPACRRARSLGRGGFATARWPGEVVGARSAWGGGRLVLAKRD
jgi:hypothetical protein